MSDHTRSVLSTSEALDFAITAIRLMSRDEAIAIVAAVRDHLDGAQCDDQACGACYEATNFTAAPLTRREAKANAREPWICPRCHDTKSQGRDLCGTCEAGLR